MEKNMEHEMETGMISGFICQVPPGTLYWGHVPTKSRYLSPNEGWAEGLGMYSQFPCNYPFHRPFDSHCGVMLLQAPVIDLQHPCILFKGTPRFMLWPLYICLLGSQGYAQVQVNYNQITYRLLTHVEAPRGNMCIIELYVQS